MSGVATHRGSPYGETGTREERGVGSAQGGRKTAIMTAIKTYD
jgi:hypothetical protein